MFFQSIPEKFTKTLVSSSVTLRASIMFHADELSKHEFSKHEPWIATELSTSQQLVQSSARRSTAVLG
jgi:hypothetical protein